MTTQRAATEQTRLRAVGLFLKVKLPLNVWDGGLHDEGIVSGHTPLPGSKSAVNANLTKFILYKLYNLIRMAVV